MDIDGVGTVTQCLKVDSNTSVKFSVNNTGSVYIYIRPSQVNSSSIKINGTEYIIDSSEVVEIEIEAGTYEIRKGNRNAYIYYIYVSEKV